MWDERASELPPPRPGLCWRLRRVALTLSAGAPTPSGPVRTPERPRSAQHPPVAPSRLRHRLRTASRGPRPPPRCPLASGCAVAPCRARGPQSTQRPWPGFPASGPWRVPLLPPGAGPLGPCPARGSLSRGPGSGMPALTTLPQDPLPAALSPILPFFFAHCPTRNAY